MGSEAAKKAWETRRRKEMFDSLKRRIKLKRRKPVGGVVLTPKPVFKAISKVTGKPVTVKKRPTAKGTAAAKKAWETRRANAEDPVQAEAERQEALRVLDELAKNRPPVTEE